MTKVLALMKIIMTTRMCAMYMVIFINRKLGKVVGSYEIYVTSVSIWYVFPRRLILMTTEWNVNREIVVP